MAQPLHPLTKKFLSSPTACLRLTGHLRKAVSKLGSIGAKQTYREAAGLRLAAQGELSEARKLIEDCFSRSENAGDEQDDAAIVADELRLATLDAVAAAIGFEQRGQNRIKVIVDYRERFALSAYWAIAEIDRERLSAGDDPSDQTTSDATDGFSRLIDRIVETAAGPMVDDRPSPAEQPAGRRQFMNPVDRRLATLARITEGFCRATGDDRKYLRREALEIVGSLVTLAFAYRNARGQEGVR
jgi:hypothetical protein